jgi:uncharacterized protein YndB with AHSA1/START domain
MLALVVLVPAAIAFGVVPLMLFLWGRTLPSTHQARQSAHVTASPEAIFALLIDVRAIPRWRPTVRRVVPIATEPYVRYREHGAQGALVLEIEAQVPPSKLALRTAPAQRMAFEGTWTYELTPEDDGTRVTLTERGTVRSPFARIFAIYVLGHHTHVERTLAALVKRFRR